MSRVPRNWTAVLQKHWPIVAAIKATLLIIIPHQGNFLEELDQERAPVMLVKAIAVSASQYIPSTIEMTRQIIQWSQEVDAFIMGNLGTFSIHNLQILIIWANHHHSNGNLGKTWMLHGLTTRLAYCLQINTESVIGSPIEIECRRRMM